MEFKTLSKRHVNQLLDFELQNKRWFESFIEPREHEFYSNSGVAKHIDFLLNQMDEDKAYSGVLVKNNMIVARANLKDISGNCAYIGYRVAQDFTSQGLASYCLSQLIEIAQDKFNLQQLKAQVLDNNPASAHVLKKCGFQALGVTPNFLSLNGKQLNCTELGLKLA